MFSTMIQLCAVLILFSNNFIKTKSIQNNNGDYWEERLELEQKEQTMHLGYGLQLNENEVLANSILMEAKHAELDNGLETPVNFLPSMNFLKAQPLIKQSKVFQIIQKVPKGAVLHAHTTAMVSTEFLYNLTYTENLYICETNTSEIRFKFALKTPEQTIECDKWDLLSDLRINENVTELNEKIRSSFTLLVDNPDTIYFDINAVWKKFNEIFATLKGFLNYKPVLEMYLYQVFKEFYDDKILHLEFRGALHSSYEINGTVYNDVELVGIYRNIVNKFQKDYPNFSVKIIYAPPRLVNQTVFDGFIELAGKLNRTYPDFVAGFDLVGQEDAGVPLIEFADKLSTLQNMNFFFHAGETNWKGMTDTNLIDAILLGTKRIGHGYAITKHPVVMQLVKQKQICIEISPISNQVLNLVKDLRNHPAAALFSKDFPIVISNDDPSFWGAIGLSYDFYEAFMAFTSYNDDIRVLKQLGINSIQFSSMSEEQKNEAFKLFFNQWDNFIDEMVKEYYTTPDKNNLSSSIF